ncbi:hypothetical protein [Roseococcus sp. YIM B11640]|uniref:hypothetical protein n=1 Tax=Roseococcus sp. YIM B11640 TaxID=3133973 RepID=UPI003C7A2E34
MTAFRTLFAVDVVIACFALWQCHAIATSPVLAETGQSYWPVVAPLLIVVSLGILVLGGAALLHGQGHTGVATVLLLVPAVPTLIAGAMFLALMVMFYLHQ